MQNLSEYIARQAAIVERELREADAREPSPAMQRIRRLYAQRRSGRQLA
jgi:hypothetical protein